MDRDVNFSPASSDCVISLKTLIFQGIEHGIAYVPVRSQQSKDAYQTIEDNTSTYILVSIIEPHQEILTFLATRVAIVA